MSDEKMIAFWELSFSIAYEKLGSGQVNPVRTSFGWDREQRCFHLMMVGVGAPPETMSLPMPVELAEKFLLACRDPVYGACFLFDTCPRAEGRLCSRGTTLILERHNTQYVGRAEIYPGLHMRVMQEGKELVRQLYLTHELRRRLGEHLLKLEAEDVVANLRLSAPV